MPNYHLHGFETQVAMTRAFQESPIKGVRHVKARRIVEESTGDIHLFRRLRFEDDLKSLCGYRFASVTISERVKPNARNFLATRV